VWVGFDFARHDTQNIAAYISRALRFTSCAEMAAFFYKTMTKHFFLSCDDTVKFNGNVQTWAPQPNSLLAESTMGQKTEVPKSKDAENDCSSSALRNKVSRFFFKKLGHLYNTINVSFFY
jgi:hypothetical protein